MANEVRIVVKADDLASGKFRGVAKQAGGLGDTLKKVGTIAAGFLAANVISKGFGAIKSGFSDSLALASSFEESLSKVRVVFGDSSKAVEDFAKNAAVNMGMANGAALEATGTFGNFLQAMGLARAPAADMSMAMVTLAGDLASFNNASPEEVLLALRSGLSGEAEPLRKFGVALSETAVKAQAVKMGMEAVDGKLTESQKIQARYAIIMEQTSMAQGDFARTSDGMANKERILAAKMEDLKTKFGKVLLPVKMLITEGIIKLIDYLPKLKKAFEGLIPPATLASIKDDLLPALKDIGRFLESDVLPEVRDFARVAMDVGTELARFLAPAIDTLRDAWVNLGQPLAKVLLPVLKKVGEFLLEHKPIIVGVAAAILLLVAPWLAVAAAIAVVLAKWDEISAFFTELGNDIAEFVTSTINKVRDLPVIGAIFEDAFNTAKAIVEYVVDRIIGRVGFLFDSIKNAFDFWKAIFTGDWDAAWNALKAQAGAVWELIKGEFGALLDAFRAILGSKLEMIKGVGGDLAKALGQGFSAALGWVKGPLNAAITAIESAINWIIGRWNALEFSTPAIKAFGKTIVPGLSLGTPDIPQISIPRLQAGTGFFRGGAAILGESGPEMAILPRGSRVLNAQQTAQTGGRTVHVTVNINTLLPPSEMQIADAVEQLLPEIRRAVAS